jgi:hypothetical protein
MPIEEDLLCNFYSTLTRSPLLCTAQQARWVGLDCTLSEVEQRRFAQQLLLSMIVADEPSPDNEYNMPQVHLDCTSFLDEWHVACKTTLEGTSVVLRISSRMRWK